MTQPYDFDREHAAMVERKRLRAIAKGDQREAWEQENWRRAREAEAAGCGPSRATPREIIRELTAPEAEFDN